MPERHDALVVGAGPAGTATALRLAAAGHRVLVVDKARFPRAKCCSEYASPATVQELERLGVLGSITRLGTAPLTGSSIHTDRGDLLRGRFPGGATGLALPRREVDAALLAAVRAQGIPVMEGRRLEALAPTRDGGITATLQSGGIRTTVRARVVIGADGLRSRVARHAGGVRRARLARLAIVTHVAQVDGLGDAAELHVGPRGYVGLNRIRPGQVNLALVVPASEASHLRTDPAAYLRHRVRSWPALAERIHTTEIGDAVMVTGPFDHRARRSTGHGMALVGDAADFFDPFTGEGIWAALVGARLLADTLVPLLHDDRPIHDAALAPYRRARRRQFAGKWLVERVIGHAMQQPALFRAAVRRLDHAGLGDTAIGICGDCVPVQALLSPRVLGRLVMGDKRRATGDGHPPRMTALTTHDSRLTTNGSRFHG